MDSILFGSFFKKKYNWHLIYKLYKFKVYNMLIWYIYVFQCDLTLVNTSIKSYSYQLILLNDSLVSFSLLLE